MSGKKRIGEKREKRKRGKKIDGVKNGRERVFGQKKKISVQRK